MITRVKSTEKPNKTESLGNGFWYYNFDIQQEEIEGINSKGEQQIQNGYSYIPIRISGQPTYEKCVKAVIQEYIDTTQELDLINSYNSYQLNINDNNSKYEEYLQLVKEIKEKIRKDFTISGKITKDNKPKLADITKLLLMTINNMQLTDSQALEVKTLYPSWKDFIGKQLTKDMKVQYNSKLFKVVQTHTAQIGWEPGISTASLFTEIVEDHSGTLEDPIPYPTDGNMIIYNGKYYIENGVIYLCIRDSIQPLYTALANVISNYVQVVEQL